VKKSRTLTDPSSSRGESAARACAGIQHKKCRRLRIYCVFDESSVGSPNALTVFKRSRMTDNSSSTGSNFFTRSEAGTQVTYPLAIAEFLQQSEPLLRGDLGARLRGHDGSKQTHVVISADALQPDFPSTGPCDSLSARPPPSHRRASARTATSGTGWTNQLNDRESLKQCRCDRASDRERSCLARAV
jgi:hypothetical protein